MNKKLLIAPLDWGLGHATRCVPIIRCALALQIPVILAASGRSKLFLQNEFKNIEIVDFEGYSIHYPKNSRMSLSMAIQAPKILNKIGKEHRKLKEIVEKHHIGAIISDNRYGLHHSDTYNVFMTHQLNIQAGGKKWIETGLKKINHRFINRFDELWIPDFEGTENLAGQLSHPPLTTIPTFYLGALSRFLAEETTQETFPEIVAVVSGPEPQRTLFEEKVTTQLATTDKTALIVCGTPDQPKMYQITEKIQKVGHLDTSLLAKYLANARMVIARPGYSTLMDLTVFGKKALLIPTPGQTEQEFLAQQLCQSGQCFAVSQTMMDLKKDLMTADRFSGLPQYLTDNSLLNSRLKLIREKLR